MQSILEEQAAASAPGSELIDRIDTFCGYPAGHSVRVSELAGRLAASFNVAREDREILRIAALYRDAGELRMARDYISAARPLTADELLDMQRHPVIGEQEAAASGSPDGVRLVVRWHHEWWNGDGYPDGLVGDEIPLAARILRLADCYLALTSPRPFRRAFPADNAAAYLAEWAGIQFDPSVVAEFERLKLSDDAAPAEQQ